jgi:hypothetical protein
LKRIKFKYFYKEIRKLRKKLDNIDLPEKRLIDKELGALIKSAKSTEIYVFKDDETKEYLPYIGNMLYKVKDLNNDSLINAINSAKNDNNIIFNSAEIDTSICQLKFIVLKNIVNNMEISDYDSEKLANATDIDFKTIQKALNPLDLIYSENETYSNSDDDTKSLYRFFTSKISEKIDIHETKLAENYYHFRFYKD